MFANREFYENTYLQGRAATVPPTEFNFWATKATKVINTRNVEITSIPDYLKSCCCEVAEVLFLAEEQQFMAMMPSQSVGGYSRGSVSVKPPTQGELSARIQGIITSWLAGTTLHNQLVCLGV